MDLERFVAEVRKRECLWKNNVVRVEGQGSLRDELWKRVASACNMSLQEAKTKWRSLRDVFHRHMKKVPVYTSGESYYIEESEKPRWAYFNLLLFLVETIKPQYKVIDINDESVTDMSSLSEIDSTSNIPQETLVLTNVRMPMPVQPPKTLKQVINDIVSPIQKTEEKLNNHIPFVSAPPLEEVVRIPCPRDQLPFVNGPPPLVMIQPQITNLSVNSMKRANALEASDDLDLGEYRPASKKQGLKSDINTSWLKLRNKSNNDSENLSFFRSVLPLMNKLDTVKQLELRLRLQEIILEELVS
ncbi:uncharacterized protein [Eurosta solidaginis]|uniref:uncharacterized protein isoform X4 n=1 Tax=Eurosta solidaginis TaxID=178769 RepID=UPI003530FD8D